MLVGVPLVRLRPRLLDEREAREPRELGELVDRVAAVADLELRIRYADGVAAEWRGALADPAEEIPYETMIALEAGIIRLYNLIGE